MKPLPPLAEIDRLLIVKTSSLGDVIHALPAVQALKEARPAPDARLGRPPPLRGHPARQPAILTTCTSWTISRHAGELARLRRTLHTARYEVALDMQGLALSGLITGLSGAPTRVGWDRNREMNALFLTHPVVPGRPSQVGIRHEVDLLYGFPRALGVDVPPGDFPPQPYLAEEGRYEAADRLRVLPRPRLALNVGAARAYKRWPTAHWAELAHALLQKGFGLVFVGDERDAVTVAEIKAQLPPTPNAVDVAGQTTLRELASFLAACDLVVSGDTGPMHLAVAVGTPVVALFGATDPRRHGPYGSRNVVLSDAASVTAVRPTEEQGIAAMRAILPTAVLEAVEARVAANEFAAP